MPYVERRKSRACQDRSKSRVGDSGYWNAFVEADRFRALSIGLQEFSSRKLAFYLQKGWEDAWRADSSFIS